MRDYVGNYIVTKLNNKDVDQYNVLTDDVLIGYDKFSFNNKYTVVKNYEQNMVNKNYFSNLIDISDYFIVGLTKLKINVGISDSGFSKEYALKENLSDISIYPKIYSNSNKIPLSVNLSTENKDNEIDSLYSVSKYPVNQLDILPGKYNINTLINFYQINLIILNLNHMIIQKVFL